MRNVLETGTARSRHPNLMRPPPHRAPRCRTIPASPWRGSIALAASALALGGFLHAVPVQGIEFGDGVFQGSLDTTITHGLTFRVQQRNAELAADTNGNDGDLNYDRGLVSNTSKFTTDLDIGTGDLGAFVRATGFIDFENQNGTRERTPLSDAAKDRVGKDLEVLDAYVTGTFDAGDSIVDMRLGKHVLNWGESTFIPNGINAINHFDVSKLRLPGSELREALLPVGLASLSVAPTDSLSLEAFYQLDWEETEIDPVGSYFSSTDYVGPGAREAVITQIPGIDDVGFGFGPLTPLINCDLGYVQLPPPYQCSSSEFGGRAQLAHDPDFASVLRGPDHTPDDSGQWGLALRYFAEHLNNTEFGFYFINHHSRLPVVNARTGSKMGVRDGIDAFKAVLTGGATRAAAPEAVDGIAQALALDRYAKTGHYFLEYPEDIQLFGVSFNTVLGASGWALQGEYSFRRDAPLQRAERVVLAEGLDPIVTGLGLLRAAGEAQAMAIAAGEAAMKAGAAAQMAGALASDPQTSTPETIAAAQRAKTAAEKLGAAAQRAKAAAEKAGTEYGTFLNTYTPGAVQGYIERDVSQVQATATRVFGPTMGADAFVFVTEVALMHVHDMPDKNTAPLESPAGGTLATGKADADGTSLGYRVAARLDYNNAISAVNLYPYTQFLHDVSGNSPAPSGPFVEGRTALTLGLRANYLSRWEADIGYTRYAGDGNELSDRDFISASVKYSF